MSLLTLLQQQGGGTQTVSVSPVAVRALALAPLLSPGLVTLAVPSVRVQLAAVAPSRTASVTVAVPPSQERLVAVTPSITSITTRTVSPVAVRFLAVSPATSAGPSAVSVQPVSVQLIAKVPTVVAYIPVQVARVVLIAIEPAVSGGGGPGVRVIPRSSGEGVGSMAEFVP